MTCYRVIINAQKNLKAQAPDWACVLDFLLIYLKDIRIAPLSFSLLICKTAITVSTSYGFVSFKGNNRYKVLSITCGTERILSE